MTTVYKYELQPVTTEVELTVGAQTLCVQLQKGRPCVWVKLDPNAPKIVRRFHIVGTGHTLPESCCYVGTFQLEGGALVFHVFEGLL